MPTTAAMRTPWVSWRTGRSAVLMYELMVLAGRMSSSARKRPTAPRNSLPKMRWTIGVASTHSSVAASTATATAPRKP
ncbi:Uncharacterised protein [Mycobacteroides abscessus subsp. abscessus]|nr:Uncharacterised protein [Mycobacteroides abscessus subsp. abscessus]